MLDLYSMTADPDPSDIIRIEEVMQLSGLKKTMLYDLIGKGQFPVQVGLGARAVGWYRNQVLDWNRNRPSTRRDQDGRCEKTKARSVSDVPYGDISKATSKNPCRPKKPGTGTAAVSRIRSADSPRPEPSPAIKKGSPAPASLTETEELRVLRDENARLKRLIADLVLKNDLLQSAIQGNAVAS
jgi:prophage regulatory protein